MDPQRSRQPSLKPQDILVALKLVANPDRSLTYAQLANELAISASEAHAAVQRAEFSRLISQLDGKWTPNRAAIAEFILHGLKYAFPAVSGPLSRGMPTGAGAPPLRDQLEHGDSLPSVWPDPNGDVRGMTVYPLFPSVPAASRRDTKLYELLTLVDALRGGAARERELAESALMERL